MWHHTFVLGLLLPIYAIAQTPLPQPHEYTDTMRKIAAMKTGREGVVLHIGDSITYASPNGSWARSGDKHNKQDHAILTWMHTNQSDDRDGWYLARFDHPSGGKSYTACSGIRLDELLAGTRKGLLPLDEMLKKYRPQMAIFMLGTNDASAQRKVADFQADYVRAVEIMLKAGVIPIISTIPPFPVRQTPAAEYNVAIRVIAQKYSLPLIDYEKEILTRRPDDWNGTLLGKNDVHPSASYGGTTAQSAATEENLRNSGYLLRCWLSVQKIAEVKAKVLDATGETIRLPVTRDTWVSSHPSEVEGNLGGANQLKFKSYQEFSLVDLDPKSLQGREIVSATLHLKMSGKERLHRVTVGTITADWHEGTATGYAKQVGSSSFAWRQHPDVPWSYPGSDLTSVTLGQGGSVWRMADAKLDADGWQTIPVDPLVIKQRISGVGRGFVVFDDTGSEWTRDGEKFTPHPFPNRYVYSRESGAKTAPYWTITLGDKDSAAPAPPTRGTIETTGLPSGEARIQWDTPMDDGPSGTVGFIVNINQQPAPTYLVPSAGGRVMMHLRDMKLAGGEPIKVEVIALDGAGNRSDPLAFTGNVADRPRPAFPPVVAEKLAKVHPAIPFGQGNAWVTDELDNFTVKRHAPYLWDGQSITLESGRGETVAFQLVLNGPIAECAPQLKLGTCRVWFGECLPVPLDGKSYPDPVVPITGSFSVPPDGTYRLHVEIQARRNAEVGEQVGELELGAVKIPIRLNVGRFVLPDTLSFYPEMNAYGLPGHDLQYYRLAHEHRAVLNVVPYSQRGEVTPGWGPTRKGDKLDWTEWDAKFGPLFDGSAFAGLRRGQTPIEVFYLPINENWPAKMADNYNGSYWADEAFPPEYRQQWVDVAAQFAAHFNERGWDATRFQVFLNGKNNFKVNGWSRGSSPWLLDEPAHFQDFWALRWYGKAAQEGFARAGGNAKMLFRADISRPQWQRDTLDGLLDYNVVSSSMRPYHRLVMHRKRRDGQLLIEYGTANRVDQPHTHAVAWCLDAWSLGADGVIPWQTIGTMNAWKKSEETALFYPMPNGAPPVPSLRLKAYRRGQQDVEYLTLLAGYLKANRDDIGNAMSQQLGLRGQREGTGFVGGEDAGRLGYAKINTEQLAAMRHRLFVRLNELATQPAPTPYEMPTPTRMPLPAVPGHVVGYTPTAVESLGTQPPPMGSGKTITIEGSKQVQDAVIDFDLVDKNLGAEPRNNALIKRERGNAFLVKFGLGTLPANAVVEKATLVLSVWDPSSQGRTECRIHPLRTPWKSDQVTWKAPTWANGASFDIAKDAMPSIKSAIVEPDQGADTADPPIAVQFDITPLVRDWLSGKQVNQGVAVVPTPNREVDEGFNTRFQIWASEAPKHGPKLILQLR